MNNFKNPWEITEADLSNPWEVGNGRNVLDTIRNNPKEEILGITIEDGDDRYQWKPGITYNGKSFFIKETVKALNLLITKPNVLKMKFPSGNEVVEGNVVLDFAEKGGFYRKGLIIQPTLKKEGPNFYGSTIRYGSTLGLKFYPNGTQTESKIIAPFILLLHEFVHAWLDRVNPRLKDILKTASSRPDVKTDKKTVVNAPLIPIPQRSYNDNREHDYILYFIENPACVAFNQPVRLLYEGGVWTRAELEANKDVYNSKYINALWVQTEGSTSNTLLVDEDGVFWG